MLIVNQIITYDFLKIFHYFNFNYGFYTQPLKPFPFPNNKIMSINLRKLTSISVQLAQEATHIVKDSYINKSVKQFMKTEQDPVTQADFKIQTLIINGIKQYFPHLKIVGEEEVEYKGTIDFNYQNINEQYLPNNFNLNRECSPDDLCVWIDPMDSTKGFVEDRVEDVTVLIGISEKKKASIGVIGIPFKKPDSQLFYRPSVAIGAVETKSAFQFHFDPENKKGQWAQIHPTRSSKSCRIVVSKNRHPTEDNEVIAELKGEKLLAGGSGRKVIMVAKNEAQMMLYMKSLTNKWDSCAGQAIIKAMGGYFCSPFGDELQYNAEKEQEGNMDGFFCTFDEELYRKTVEMCNKKYKKKSDEIV